MVCIGWFSTLNFSPPSPKGWQRKFMVGAHTCHGLHYGRGTSGSKPTLCLGGDVTSSLKTAYGKHYSEKQPRKRATRAFHFGHTQQECIGRPRVHGGLPSLALRSSFDNTEVLFLLILSNHSFIPLLCIGIFPCTYFFRLFSLFCCEYLPLSPQSS